MSTTTQVASIYDEIERRQLERREIAITGAIDPDTAHVLSVKLRYLADIGRQPITIHLNTPGGSVVDGLAIYDLIKQTVTDGIKVRIVVTGACMSMGTIVLQAASERIATENTAILLHELAMVNFGSLGQLKDKQAEAERLQRLLNSILIERTGLTAKKLKQLVERKDLYLTANEAKQYKIVDKVI